VVKDFKVFEYAGFFCFAALAHAACSAVETKKHPENGDSTMLVLSRKSKESVVVGGSTGFERILRVTVIEICGKRVRLGFDVEPDVPVHRMEVWERIFARPEPEASRGPPTQSAGGGAMRARPLHMSIEKIIARQASLSPRQIPL
jgi:carbon storage regulator CsrA